MSRTASAEPREPTTVENRVAGGRGEVDEPAVLGDRPAGVGGAGVVLRVAVGGLVQRCEALDQQMRGM